MKDEEKQGFNMKFRLIRLLTLKKMRDATALEIDKVVNQILDIEKHIYEEAKIVDQIKRANSEFQRLESLFQDLMAQFSSKKFKAVDIKENLK